MKNILVTGISSGIGKAICYQLVKDGYFVYGTYNSHKEEAEKIKDELKNVELFQVDFSKRENTQKLLEELKDIQFWGIVNNAGIIEFASFDELDLESYDRIMEINLNAPLIIVQTLRNNIENGGAIINIASTDGMVGAIASAPYSISKAGLINLSMSLANIFGPKKIRVNSISPGWTGDGMQSPAIQDAIWFNPLNRTGKYEEVANLVSFLISKKSPFINGTNIVIDGESRAVDFSIKKEAEYTLK